MKIIVNNEEELKNFAKEFASKLKGNELILLKGNLGAGKTTFTKYVSFYLGVNENVISPTFNIVRIYESNLGMLYHIDAYRLEDIGYDPMLDEYIYDLNALRFIEWYEFIDEPIFKDAIKIHIQILDNSSKRELDIKGGIYD